MFKVLENGTAPTRGSKYSACVDLYASETVTIGAGETKLIGLGVCIDLDWNAIHKGYNSYTSTMQKGYKDWFLSSHYLQLMLRSSLGKKGLIIPNGVGVIDLDFTQEIKVLIHNPITENKIIINNGVEIIKKGDRIAQITLLEHKSYLFGIESDVERSGGFGSTDGKD